MDLRFFNWISHKYLLLTLLLIDSLWKCLIQIALKLSSAVSRNSVSVYQVSLWLAEPKFSKAKLGSVRIFDCFRLSCVLSLFFFRFGCQYHGQDIEWKDAIPKWPAGLMRWWGRWTLLAFTDSLACSLSFCSTGRIRSKILRVGVSIGH